ncbi:MAG: DUF4352 domain-containing protein [Cytophagales bacterium]|nr:DUF4352 domain-containing protein [Armatimonadota bacterium]
MQYRNLPGAIGLALAGMMGGGALTVCAAAVAGSRILVDGSATTMEVRMIAGRPYVPLNEIARAFGRNVQKSPTGYTLAISGGANAVSGLRGKVGDLLFDGKWRFKAISVTRSANYTLAGEGGLDYARYNSVAESADAKTFTAKDGNEFVLVRCLVKNGQKSSQAFGSHYGANTALADDQGSSYRPVGFQQAGGMIVTKELIPGASQELTAVFVVPKTAKITSLVFTLTNISDDKPADVRIAL